MPHRRDPMKCEERPGRGAQRQGEGDRSKPKDSTPVSHGTAAGYTPFGRKSGPGRWVRLADVLPPVGLLRDREAA